jgi:hypothetical protein
MQPFLDPVSTSCGHHFCAHCLKRALAPQDLYADDRPQECPICRGLVGVLQPNAGLAVRVSTRFGADYADRRRTDADVPLAKPAVPALGDEARDATRDMILDAVRKQGGYRTLALNSSLDLSGGGWEELPNCLLEFSGLRQLRLEHNLLRSLGDLQLPSLLALSASHNQIQAIGGSLARATQLVRLDLSNNLLAHIDGLPPSLQSLYLAGNRLASASAAEGLAGCVALDVLDLSRNALPLDALGAMGDELRAQVSAPAPGRASSRLASQTRACRSPKRTSATQRPPRDMRALKLPIPISNCLTLLSPGALLVLDGQPTRRAALGRARQLPQGAHFRLFQIALSR